MNAILDKGHVAAVLELERELRHPRFNLTRRSIARVAVRKFGLAEAYVLKVLADKGLRAAYARRVSNDLVARVSE